LSMRLLQSNKSTVLRDKVSEQSGRSLYPAKQFYTQARGFFGGPRPKPVYSLKEYSQTKPPTKPTVVFIF
jgi:hypothetical protein